MPFFTIALAVLAFFGNNFGLFLVLAAPMGGKSMRMRSACSESIRSESMHDNPPDHPSRPDRAGDVERSGVDSAETSLSSLDLGIRPPRTSLGLILGEGRNCRAAAWWAGLPARIVVFLTRLSIGLAGDGLISEAHPFVMIEPLT